MCIGGDSSRNQTNTKLKFHIFLKKTSLYKKIISISIINKYNLDYDIILEKSKVYK